MTDTMDRIFNYIRFSSRLATAGQPLKEEIPLVIDYGTEVVLSLVPIGVKTEVPEEEVLFKAAGTIFERIPVVWEAPQTADFQTFLDKMDHYKEKNLFVHCEANMRVSVFVALYRIVVEGWETSRALEGIQDIWKPNQTWQAFIDRILTDVLDGRA